MAQEIYGLTVSQHLPGLSGLIGASNELKREVKFFLYMMLEKYNGISEKVAVWF